MKMNAVYARIYYLLLFMSVLQGSIQAMDFWSKQERQLGSMFKNYVPADEVGLPVRPAEASPSPRTTLGDVCKVAAGVVATGASIYYCPSIALAPTFLTGYFGRHWFFPSKEEVKKDIQFVAVTAANGVAKETKKELIDTTAQLFKQEAATLADVVEQRATVFANAAKDDARAIIAATMIFVDEHKAKAEADLVKLRAEAEKTGAALRATVKNDVKEFVTELKKDFKNESTSLLTKVLGGTVVAITAFFASKLIWDKVDRHINKPRLDYKVTPIEALLNGGTKKPNPFTRLVLSQGNADQLMGIVEKTALTKRRILEGDQTCTYRGLLLCGPKGSGKRLFAENLARYVGMDFIDLSVGSLTKYKEETDVAKAYKDFFEGVASKSFDGALVFIDNAGILLSHRRPTDNTPLSRQIAGFIEQVEKGSNKFMVVMAAQTEHEPNLTATMSSIIQNPIIVFTKPDVAQRIKILEMYRDLLFAGPDISNECAESVLLNFSDEKIKEMAKRLEGAVATDVFEIVKSIKMDALVSQNDEVTEKSVDKVVQDTIEKIEKRKKRDVNA